MKNKKATKKKGVFGRFIAWLLVVLILLGLIGLVYRCSSTEEQPSQEPSYEFEFNQDHFVV